MSEEVERKRESESGTPEESVDPNQGLTADEAERRLDRDGPDTIEEEEESWLATLLSHFWGPIPWMLETAVALAVVAQRWEDFGVILAMLLINGGIGFWHENRAQNAIRR